MAFKCKIGEHRWSEYTTYPYKCEICGKFRSDEPHFHWQCIIKGHDWSGCLCRRCGKTRDSEHSWDGCICRNCKKIKDENHKWSGCICKECKKTKHEWVEGKCSKCGCLKIDWVNIPAGTFLMGSPKSEIGRDNECETQHEVTLNSFMISKYAITFEQYDVFCEATGYPKPHDEGWGRGKRPVINVNLDEAFAFATWMGCRLPSEAEWEYACRAGSTTPYNTGNELKSTQANFGNNSSYSIIVEETVKDLNKVQGLNQDITKNELGGKTLPVGSFPPNAWDLYEMHGNVEEWTCTPWSGDYATKANSKPKFVSKEITIRRGGCWKFSAQDCRSASRDANYTVNTRKNYFGFRIVEGRNWQKN